MVFDEQPGIDDHLDGIVSGPCIRISQVGGSVLEFQPDGIDKVCMAPCMHISQVEGSVLECQPDGIDKACAEHSYVERRQSRHFVEATQDTRSWDAKSPTGLYAGLPL